MLTLNGIVVFIAVNRRLRKSTSALSTLFSALARLLLPLYKHTYVFTHVYTVYKADTDTFTHTGVLCVRVENSRREASVFTLRPLVERRLTRRKHRMCS